MSNSHMSATRAPRLSSRLTGRRARLFNALAGAAIALAVADVFVLAGARLASPDVGRIVLPLATAAVAAGLAYTRLIWERGDRLLWILLAAGLTATLGGGV